MALTESGVMVTQAETQVSVRVTAMENLEEHQHGFLCKYGKV